LNVAPFVPRTAAGRKQILTVSDTAMQVEERSSPSNTKSKTQDDFRRIINENE
jgi:predicted subunit of tRNA(5-methylaminomethyl-2-thiouridylate) methyltransferase